MVGMADIGRSSFIPKETSGLVPGKLRRKRTFHIFGFISTTLLVGSLALAAGVYFLKSSAESGLESARNQLAEQNNLFKSEYITEIREFDRRIHAAEALVQNHVAPLKVFAALEDATKQNIQFTTFSLEHDPSRDIILSLSGTTREFKSLALQEIQFGDHTLLKDMVIEQVAFGDSIGEEGTSEGQKVTFSLKGTLDMGLVRYDGTPVFAEVPAVFLDANNMLTVGDGTPAVLGESIINEDI
jgi:hypothetical protein